jgi:hypothetical protein
VKVVTVRAAGTFSDSTIEFISEDQTTQVAGMAKNAQFKLAVPRKQKKPRDIPLLQLT